MDGNKTHEAKQLVVERIKESTNILVTVENNPTVDELAAALALTVMLNKMDKHATAVFSGVIPPAINFLEPNKTFEHTADSLRDFIIALDKDKADRLRYKVEDDLVKIFITPYQSKITEKDFTFSQGEFNVELVLALGVEKQDSLDRAIAAHGRILHDATVATINARDEHSTLGSIDWQDPHASSICEMLAALTDSLQPKLLDQQISTALLTGIVAATDRFSNDHTSPHVMTIAAELMAAGANQQLIANSLAHPAPAPRTSRVDEGRITRDDRRNTPEEAKPKEVRKVPEVKTRPAESKATTKEDDVKGEMVVRHDEEKPAAAGSTSEAATKEDRTKESAAKPVAAEVPTVADELSELSKALDTAADNPSAKDTTTTQPNAPAAPPVDPIAAAFSQSPFGASPGLNLGGNPLSGGAPTLRPASPAPTPNQVSVPAPTPPAPAPPIPNADSNLQMPAAPIGLSPTSSGQTTPTSVTPASAPSSDNVPKITPLGQNLAASKPGWQPLEPPTLGGTLNATTAEAEAVAAREAEEAKRHNNVTLSHGTPGSLTPPPPLSLPSNADALLNSTPPLPSAPAPNGLPPLPPMPGASSPTNPVSTAPGAPAGLATTPNSASSTSPVNGGGSPAPTSDVGDLEAARQAVSDALGGIGSPEPASPTTNSPVAPSPTLQMPAAPSVGAPGAPGLPGPTPPASSAPVAQPGSVPPMPDFSTLPPLPPIGGAPNVPGPTGPTAPSFSAPTNMPNVAMPPNNPGSFSPTPGPAPLPPLPGNGPAAPTGGANQFRIPGQ